jgi:hypothetical protein
MQISLPALPLPRFHALMAFEHARGWSALLGPLVLVSWLLPWGHGAWSWTLGEYWGLLAGLTLTTLAFAPIPNLKRGHVFLATALLGVAGLGWTGAVLGGALFFFLSSLGLFGLAAVLTALVLWLRHGHRPLYEQLLLGGLVGLGLGLLIPMGHGFPLVRLFSQLGDDAPNIVARLFVTLSALAFLGLLGLLVTHVLLRKAAADRVQIERLATLLFFSPFALLFLCGFLTFFSGFAGALHLIILLGASLFLAVQAAVVTIEAAERGESYAVLIARP